MRLFQIVTFLFLVESTLSRKSAPSAATSRRGSSRQPEPVRKVATSRRRPVLDDEYDSREPDDIEDAFDDDDQMDDFEEDQQDFYDDEEELEPRPSSRRSSKPLSSRRSPSSSSQRTSRSSRQRRPSNDEWDEEPMPSRSRRSSSASRRTPPRRATSNRGVVPYRRKKGPSAFTRGIQVLRNSMPDPSTVREAAMHSITAAREATSGLSANLYRDIKGLTSSELEQVMLKATRPDDAAVKGKHAERLVGVTYQISSRYDIYDAVLRKLWAKMAEKDWRTTIKALYLLHRFSADGAPEHAPALKARLRELRRTRDPKRKEKYFNSKQLLAGDHKPETTSYRAFLSRYAHYVLLRAQCFGGMFDELSLASTTNTRKSSSSSASAAASTSSPKPVTATALRVEHLEAAQLLLKAGLACQLKSGEECENTAIAVERVVSDLMSLTSTVATTLNKVLTSESKKDCASLLEGSDRALIRQWCEFYQELSPKTKTMIQRMTPKLDAYGQFLPSRIGASVSQDVLQKGLSLEDESAETAAAEEDADAAPEQEPVEEPEEQESPEPEEAVAPEGGDVYDDEYYDEDDDYYDEEDE
eukprot:Nitzschia sp. Nitz4//scaffold19_size178191//172482//174239//NITZ4_002016-RA/size178191-processed-gene-0.40-mRNA-1//1//CDS//3329540798//4536//frame0